MKGLRNLSLAGLDEGEGLTLECRTAGAADAVDVILIGRGRS